VGRRERGPGGGALIGDKRYDGVFGLLVAQQERRKGSAWWAWVVPGTFGVLLIVVGLVRLVWVV
jgi:hypothetical protein